MLRFASFLACVCLTIPSSAADRAMSHEEVVVRQTYAKLAFAAQLGAVHEGLSRSHGAPSSTSFNLDMHDGLHFDVNSCTTGNLADIAERPYGMLVEKPSGEEVLDVTTGTYTFTHDADQTAEPYVKAKWVKGQDLRSQDWMSVTMSKALTMMDDHDYSRYASCSITVSLEGRSKTYNSLFLFGQDKTKAEKVLAIDLVAGNAAVTHYVDHSVYPSALLETDLRSNPTIDKWLRANQVKSAYCKAGTKEACCDPQTGVCGLAAGDVEQKSDAKPEVKPVTQLPKSGSSGSSRESRLLLTSLRIPTVKNAYLPVCEDLSYTTGPYPYGALGTEEHVNGSHQFAVGQSGECDYFSDPLGSTTCTVAASANSGASTSDNGLITGIGFDCHVINHNEANGISSGISASASSSSAAAVRHCQLCLCSVQIGMSPISFPADSVWTNSVTYTNSCPAKRGNPTPVIIDTDGKGYHLTSASDGVMFDIHADGKPIQVAWSQAGSSNGFLALDRNGNGKIDDGSELFGDHTAQPKSDDPNGFIALAEFDKPSGGGNGDGIIDAKDAVWPNLRVWIDTNHDGISQPDELHKLSEFKIESIDLKYRESRKKDEYGNVFRYRGTIDIGKDTTEKPDRVIYDVFLTIEQ